MEFLGSDISQLFVLLGIQFNFLIDIMLKNVITVYGHVGIGDPMTKK